MAGHALSGGDALLVVPPGAHLDRPALGVHALQATARAGGFRVEVLYANALYAARVGAERYAAFCDAPLGWFLTERLFAGAAWGRDALHTDRLARALSEWERYREEHQDRTYFSIYELEFAEAEARALVEEVAARTRGYAVVGASSTFDQNNAALAILSAVKRENPVIWTVLGGRNTDGPMVTGLAALPNGPDFLVTGEADLLFPKLLEQLLTGAPPAARVLSAPLVEDLGALPLPDTSAFFEQLDALDLGEQGRWQVYEASRGCWWGLCRFCGLVGTGMRYRSKAPEQVARELVALGERGPRRVSLADNTLGKKGGQDLARALSGQQAVSLFVEVRPPISIDGALLLREAGVFAIQPGIESLSTPLLRAMRKGTTAQGALQTLRSARIAGLEVKWNLLFGVPGDEEAPYREQLALLPLLEHLAPPVGLGPIALERFSPWFEGAGKYGILNLQPAQALEEVYPEGAPLGDLAYWWEGDIPSASLANPEIPLALSEAVARWRRAWQAPAAPTLWLSGPNPWTLLDTRGGKRNLVHLSEAQARTLLTGGALDSPGVAWALRQGYLALVDGRAEPLALCTPALLALVTASP